MTTKFRTNDPARWGNGIGRDLTAAEIDGNLWDQITRLAALESDRPQPDNIASITASGTAMIVTLQSGTQIGPLPLPVLMFRWRDDFAPDTDYAQLDAFKVDTQGLYVVLVDHTSASGTFDEGAVDDDGDPLYRKLFGFSGASGVALADLTDIALTSLADKDILQWNATSGKWENIHPSAITGLASLSDVQFTGLVDKQVLRYVSSAGKWENTLLGSMADQNASAVAITGGTITGLADPTANSDAANKHYVDITAAAGVPSIADAKGLFNLSGSSAVPIAHSLSEWFDYVLGSTRGDIVFRGAAGWVILGPGTAGYFLKTGGAGADPSWDVPVGSGTVTNIASGTGLTGGPITSTGTLSLAAIADGDLLANISGGSAAPTATTLSLFLDHVMGSLRGALLYRGSTAWQVLNAGTSGYYLKTQGGGADPMWDSPAGSGTVTSVGSGTGLTGGPITSTGTLSLAAIADGDVLANTSGGSAAPIATTLTALIDHAIGNTRGSVLTRGASAWTALAPGTSGQYLKSNGAGADVGWASSSSTLAGLGDVNITSPADKQYLRYDSGSSKWVNVSTAYFTSGTVNGNAAALPAVPTGTLWQIGNADNSNTASVLDGFGTGIAFYVSRRARGTAASPTALQSGNLLGGYLFFGYGATGYSTSERAGFGASASENWTDSAQGMRLLFETTPSGGTATAIVAALHTGLQLGSGGSITGGDMGLGTVNVSGGYYILGVKHALSDEGDVTITSAADKDTLVYDNASGKWKNQRAKYIIGAAALSGVLTASQNLLYHRFSKAVTIPANFGSYLGHTSEAGGTANATASTVINVDKAASASPNSFSNVGTITIGAGGVTPTFASSGGTTITFAQGDVLRIQGPASADATFADFYATLVGYET